MRRPALLLLLVALAACDASPSARARAEAKAGLALAKEGDVSAAIARFEEALGHDPENVAARFNLGLAHLRMGQWILAAEELERFAELRPDDARGHFELARARALAGWADPALQSLAQAVRLGFADYELLVRDDVFSALYRRPQYVGLEATVAQRAGATPRGGALAGPGSDLLGRGTQTLPGVRLRAKEPVCR